MSFSPDEHESTSTQDDFNLSPDTVIKFIHRVKSMPVLYNQDHEHFRNVAIKQKAWAEISKEFGKSEKWCLKKWISLRDYFVKRKKRLRSNFGASFRPWIYYDELSFLNVIYGHDQLDYYPPNATDSVHQEEDTSGYFLYQKEDDSFEPEMINSGDGGEHVEEDSNAMYLDQKLEINHDNEQAQNSDDDDDENYSFVQPQVEISQEIEDDDEDDDVMQPNTRRSSNRIHLHGSTTIELRPAASHHRRRPPPNQKSAADRAIVMPRLSSSLTTRSPPQQQLEDAPPMSSFATGQKRILTTSDPDPSSSRPYLIKRTKKVHPQQVIEVEDDDHDQEDDAMTPIGNGHPSVHPHSLASIPHMTDPYDLFCLSIAAQLKKMPRDKAILMQIEIMNLLYQSEFSENNKNNSANK